MQQASKIRIAVAFVILVAIVMPPAGTHFRIALETLFGPPPGKADRVLLWNPSARTSLHPTPLEAAARMPNDSAVQLAALKTSAPDALRRLAARFPQDALLRVRIVEADLRACPLDRPDLSWPLTGPGDRRRPPAPIPPGARALEADAAEGERIDASNAFFPFLRAHSLFAQHRDSEALGALTRAGRADRWDDYSDRAAFGHARLIEVRLGPLSSNEWCAVRAQTTETDDLFLGLTSLRGDARVAVGWALQLEAAHRGDEALAIRMPIARCGGLLRRDGHVAFLTFVGTAIQAMALSERATSGAAKLTVSQQQEQAAIRLAHMQSRLRDRGRPDVAEGLAAAVAAGIETRQTMGEALNRDVFGLGPLSRLTAFEYALYVVLLGAVWLLVPTALALARRAPSRGRAWLIGSAGLVVAAIVNSRALYRLTPGITERPMHLDDVAPALLIGSLSLIVPAICLIAAAALRRLTRLPYSTCITRSAPTLLAVAGATAAAMLWIVSTLDASFTKDLARGLRHEGRFCAATAGKPWPEAVAPKFR